MRLNITRVISNHVIKNKTTQKILKYAYSNPSLFESIFVFSLATTIRPATIALTPSDKEDKKFYLTRSIVSGVLDLATNALYFIPVHKLTKTLCTNLEKTKGSIYFNNAASIDALKTIINRGGKLLILPIQVGLLFKVLPKITEKIFGNRKGDLKNENNNKKQSIYYS